MSIQTQGSNASMPRGPVTLPASNTQVIADGPFTKGIYVRPNLRNTGTIPAEGFCWTSPDIWVSGTQPADPKDLAGDSSYACASDQQITVGTPNYIYVRGKNGAQNPKSAQVRLYAIPSSLILWPDSWREHGIPTDREHGDFEEPKYDTQFDKLDSGKIGVAKNVFVWLNPTLPEGQQDHFCFIAWLNDEGDPNPFPDITRAIDMAGLVRNNLQWGWRNVSVVGTGKADIQISTRVSIDLKNQDVAEYSIQVTNRGFDPNEDGKGWVVELSCSQQDADGKSIKMSEKMPARDCFVGRKCKLGPGWSGLLTVTLRKNNGKDAVVGSAIDVEAIYITNHSVAEMQEALDRGLVDFPLSYALRDADPSLPPALAVRLGGDRIKII